jgi:hypothetical protein
MNNLFAGMLVFEINTAVQPVHVDFVEEIACRSFNLNCKKFLVNDLLPEYMTDHLKNEIHKASTVNMSFIINPPLTSNYEHQDRYLIDSRWPNEVSHFYKQSKTMREIIKNNLNTLFVAAAGNGVRIGPVNLPGSGLTRTTPIYPVFIKSPHLITVAAIASTPSDFLNQNTPDFKVSKSSNFGLDTVDVAAPASQLYPYRKKFFTSFATPYVSKIAERLSKIDPSLTAQQRAQIIKRSCFVPDVSGAIWATRDLNEKLQKSIVYKAQFYDRYHERINIVKEYFNEIIFVKCGGVVIEDIAYQCAYNFKSSEKTIKNLDEACYNAHRNSEVNIDNNISDLKELWKLRQL